MQPEPDSRHLRSEAQARIAQPACNAQEMLALASFMSGAAMGDVTGHFKEAFHRYNTAAAAAHEPKSLVRYATRTAMLLAEYARAHRQFTDAHLALMRAHFQACRPASRNSSSTVHAHSIVLACA